MLALLALPETKVLPVCRECPANVVLLVCLEPGVTEYV